VARKAYAFLPTKLRAKRINACTGPVTEHATKKELARGYLISETVTIRRALATSERGVLRTPHLRLGAVDNVLDRVFYVALGNLSFAFGFLSGTLCLLFMIIDGLADCPPGLSCYFICLTGNLVRCTTHHPSPLNGVFELIANVEIAISFHGPAGPDRRAFAA